MFHSLHGPPVVERGEGVGDIAGHNVPREGYGRAFVNVHAEAVVVPCTLLALRHTHTRAQVRWSRQKIRTTCTSEAPFGEIFVFATFDYECDAYSLTPTQKRVDASCSGVVSCLDANTQRPLHVREAHGLEIFLPVDVPLRLASFRCGRPVSCTWCKNNQT